jgi:hypothetical protein
VHVGQRIAQGLRGRLRLRFRMMITVHRRVSPDTLARAWASMIMVLLSAMHFIVGMPLAAPEQTMAASSSSQGH